MCRCCNSTINSSSNISVVQGGSVTLRLSGSNITGTRTLAQRGICNVLCVASNEFIITGSGLAYVSLPIYFWYFQTFSADGGGQRQSHYTARSGKDDQNVLVEPGTGNIYAVGDRYTNPSEDGNTPKSLFSKSSNEFDRMGNILWIIENFQRMNYCRMIKILVLRGEERG